MLTRWRYNSGPSGAIRLKLFRPTGTPKQYEAVGDGTLHTLSPNTGYEFKEQIPVKQGYLLGLETEGRARAGVTSAGGTANIIRPFTTEVPVGSTGTVPDGTDFPNSRLGIAATVESDADKDGFGDDTQDECPTDASTHDACPRHPTRPHRR